ncbi:MAG TPA: ABC transporter ATP-binding protein, partial [Candidatus Polarisedimenticolia bacterium]|nr:ABC transporter ATP-binding protein [Candidatus Polarisedimenticolia bacterium]
RAIPGVIGVERDGAEGGYVVEMEGERDVREAIAARIVGQGWGLMEMRPLTLSLEEVFIRIVREEPA